MTRRVLGPDHSETLDDMDGLDMVYLKQQNFVAAETLSREYLTILERNSPDSWRRHYGQVLLGASLAGQQRYAEAEPLLVSGYQRMMQRKAAIPLTFRGRVPWAEERIVQLYQSWGKPEKAAEWQAKLQMK